MLGARISKRYKLICFDEFHVADITDAMILHRLLVSLFDNGVGFVTTSNFVPMACTQTVCTVTAFFPTDCLAQQRMEVVNVDNGTDYRRRALEHVKLYHPAGARADAAMNKRSTNWSVYMMKTRCCTLRRARFVRAQAGGGGVV